MKYAEGVDASREVISLAAHRQGGKALPGAANLILPLFDPQRPLAPAARISALERQRRTPWARSSASTSARPTASSRSWRAREPKVIVNEEGSRITPSVVAWDEKGEVLVGQIAKRQAVTNPENTDLLGQALHRSPLRRDRRGDRSASRTRSSRATNGDARFDVRGKQISPAGGQRQGPAEAQEGGRGLPGREGDRGGHHGARVLQRRAAPGHQGRRAHRGPRGQAHRQRAHGRGARLRPRQEEGRDHRGLRLRRRHVRHLDPRGGRQRRAGHHAPTATRTSAATTSTTCHRLAHRRVQEEHQGIDVSKDKMVLQRLKDARREGQDRALERAGDHHQPAVPHGRRHGARSTSTCACRAPSSSR